MTWSFGASTSARDRVRFHLGDIYSTAQLVSDEVIDLALNLKSSAVLPSAISVAESQAAFVLRQGQSVAVGDFKISHGQTADGWLALADRLRRVEAQTAGPFVGGQGVSDKNTRAADTTITQPAFTRDLFTFGTSSTST